jgi:hypothetical protein
MAGRTLTVYLAADTTKFRAGMAGAEGSMKGLDDNVGGLSGKLSGMLGPALLGAAAAAGAMAVKIGVDGVQAAIADDQAATKLATTMTNLGLAHDTTQVEAMIDALQRETGVADDQLRPAFGRLVTSLGDTEMATDALKLAMDISAGTGKDLDTVVAALSKAYDGNTGSLSRLGAGLDTQILKTGDMDLITQELAKTFAGQADKAAGTYQGSIDRLSVGFDELKESFGAGFLEGLGNADAKTGDLTETMAGLEDSMKSLGVTLADTLETLGSLFEWALKVDEAFNTMKDSLGPLGNALDLVTSPLRFVGEQLEFLSNQAREAQGAIDALKSAARNLPVVGGVFQ